MAQVMLRILDSAFDAGNPLEAFANSKHKARIPVITSMEEGAYYAGGYSVKPPQANGPYKPSPYAFDITTSGHVLNDESQYNNLSQGGRSIVADLVERGIIEVLLDNVAQSVAVVANGTLGA